MAGGTTWRAAPRRNAVTADGSAITAGRQQRQAPREQLDAAILSGLSTRRYAALRARRCGRCPWT